RRFRRRVAKDDVRAVITGPDELPVGVGWLDVKREAFRSDTVLLAAKTERAFRRVSGCYRKQRAEQQESFHRTRNPSVVIEAAPVTARLIDGREIAKTIEAEVIDSIARLGFAPGLVAVRVGNDPA